MTRWLGYSLGLFLACGSALAQDPAWQTGQGRQPTNHFVPAASLGMPRAMPKTRSDSPSVSSVEIRPAAFANEPAPPPSSAILQPPPPEFEAPPPFRPFEPEPPLPRSSFSSEPDRPARSSSNRYHHRTNFGEILEGTRLGDGLKRRDGLFSSDHCFDYFISPVTNPFLFEDPRSLTEIRPIFMIQSIPNNNFAFQGGNAEFFGAQFRVAITDRFSLVVNKLGAVAINPGDTSNLSSEFGFAEIDFGPKFTFLRSEEGRALGAAGLIFQIPAGSSSVFQDTGNLSLVPYVSLAKNLFETRLGSLNVMDTFGYSFGTTSQRSDYFYNSVHLSWDVMNRHTFFPLVELNWFYYSSSGTARNLGTEGRDLANIGSTDMGGINFLHVAPGFRYQFSQRASFGAAVEIPLTSGTRDMQHYRATLDFIWRY